MLERAGFPAAHWSRIGFAPAPDAEIMAYAKAHDWVVLTNDLDFSAMLTRTGDDRPIVVQIRADNLSPEAIGRSVLTALEKLHPGEDAGAVITIDPKRTRVRLLPFPKL